MRQILLAHRLRQALANPCIILVCEKSTGKSTALQTVCHLYLELHGEEKLTTVTPRMYNIPDLGLRVLDCPPADSPTSFVLQDVLPIACKLPGAVCMVFLDCLNPSTTILQSVRREAEPRRIIVCLNKMDVWLSRKGIQFPQSPLSTEEMKEVSTIVKCQWDKVILCSHQTGLTSSAFAKAPYPTPETVTF